MGAPLRRWQRWQRPGHKRHKEQQGRRDSRTAATTTVAATAMAVGVVTVLPIDWFPTPPHRLATPRLVPHSVLRAVVVRCLVIANATTHTAKDHGRHHYLYKMELS